MLYCNDAMTKPSAQIHVRAKPFPYKFIMYFFKRRLTSQINNHKENRNRNKIKTSQVCVSTDCVLPDSENHKSSSSETGSGELLFV